MINEKKKNVPLVIALSIPVIMIVLIAVSIYLPTIFVKPQADFIYSLDRNSYCGQNKYEVKNRKISESEVKNPPNNNYCTNANAKLFYYDVKRNTASELSFAEAQDFWVDSSWISPDGFEIASGGGSFDIFYLIGSGGDYYRRYLKKRTFSRRLNTGDRGSTYYYEFRFLGWVKGGNNG